jgi:outer membrane receptor protein involved in Fe transport
MFITASAKYQFSPRIGLSYPISEKGAIHLSYGHFFQVPPFEYLYRNPNYRIALSGDFPDLIGNIIGNADLQPQQTTMYELGLQQEIFRDFGLNVTAYYKDIRNLLGQELHIKNNFKKFGKYINRDYGAVKGFIIAFEKRMTNHFGFNVDYTFQQAQGNASDPNDAFENEQANPPIETNKQLVPLDWDRLHSLNISVTVGTPGDFLASTIGRIGSGLPYTPSIQDQRTGLENSDKRPTYNNVDLFLTKYFKVSNQFLSVFLKVYNLFDTANEIDVFTDTGRAGYSLELTREQSQPRGVNTIEEYFIRPDYYSAPRQIIFGLGFNF